MGLFRFFFYPLSRAGEQARDSAASLRAATGAARRKLDELSEEGAVSDPELRFAELAEHHQWSDAELKVQMVAVRRTKFFAMCSTVLAFLLIFYLAVGVPLFLSLLLIPASLFTIALGLVMTLKYTLFQEQLRRKSLVSLKAIMSEDGFWAYVFK